MRGAYYMPGFTTHYLFGIKVYKDSTDRSIKKMISSHPQAYQLGLQGPDIFFYYLPNLFKRSTKALASLMHESRTGLFFKNAINEIDKYHGKDQEVAFAYLSGFLCHYCLDTMNHPYIYAATKYPLYKNYAPTSSEQLIYYASHRTFETQIDTILLDYYKHTKPTEFHKENTLKIDKLSKRIITALLSSCINKTYYNKPINYKFNQLNKIGEKYKKSSYTIHPQFVSKVFQYARLECMVLSNLKGYKRESIKSFEERYLKYNLLSSLLPDDDYIKEDILNLKKVTWFSPWEPDIQRNESFLELYNMASNKCTSILDLLNSFFFIKEKSWQTLSSTRYTEINCILELIGNLSYHSGLASR